MVPAGNACYCPGGFRQDKPDGEGDHVLRVVHGLMSLHKQARLIALAARQEILMQHLAYRWTSSLRVLMASLPIVVRHALVQLRPSSWAPIN